MKIEAGKHLASLISNVTSQFFNINRYEKFIRTILPFLFFLNRMKSPAEKGGETSKEILSFGYVGLQSAARQSQATEKYNTQDWV